jgi:hypothetical protein
MVLLAKLKIKKKVIVIFHVLNLVKQDILRMVISVKDIVIYMEKVVAVYMVHVVVLVANPADYIEDPCTCRLDAHEYDRTY